MEEEQIYTCRKCGITYSDKSELFLYYEKTICRECRKKQYRDYSRKRLMSSKESYFKSVLNSTKNRCIKNGREFEITVEQMVDLFEKQNGKCALTGMDLIIKMDKKNRHDTVSIDRIDSDKGYTLDNVQLICYAINRFKSNMPDNMFMEFISRLYTNLILK